MFLTSAADFLLYFFLVPETRGRKLPDHMPGESKSVSEKADGTKGGTTTATHETANPGNRESKESEKEKASHKESKEGEDK